MFARVLSCALCALCVASPAVAETVTYDFRQMGMMPDWLVSNGIWVPGQGLRTSSSAPGTEASVFRIDVGTPIRIDQIVVSANSEALSVYFGDGMCTHDGVTRPILTSMPDGQPWHLFTQDLSCYSAFDIPYMVLDAGEIFDFDYTILGTYLAALNGITFTTRMAGDSDDDFDVDLTDLNNVRNHFGETFQFDSISPGDVVRSGAVDLADLNMVRNRFGSSAPVPEPSALALLVLSLVTTLRIWRTAPPR